MVKVKVRVGKVCVCLCVCLSRLGLGFYRGGGSVRGLDALSDSVERILLGLASVPRGESEGEGDGEG